MSIAPPLFEIEPFQAEALEGAAEIGRRGRSARPSVALRGPRRPQPRPRPRGPQRGAGRFDSYALDDAPAGEPASLPEASPRASEYVRWVQFTLNRALGTSLPVDGVMSAATRAALRTFQRRQGLPVSGFVGPDTEAALSNAQAQAPASDPEFEMEQELSGDALEADRLLRSRPRQTFTETLRGLGKKPQRGLYRIYHKNGDFYTGMATDLRRRLVQHHWCLAHLGAPRTGYGVVVLTCPKLSDERIRSVERRINAHYIQLGDPKSLNKQAEFEMAELTEL